MMMMLIIITILMMMMTTKISSACSHVALTGVVGLLKAVGEL